MNIQTVISLKKCDCVVEFLLFSKCVILLCHINGFVLCILGNVLEIWKRREIPGLNPTEFGFPAPLMLKRVCRLFLPPPIKLQESNFSLVSVCQSFRCL